MPCRERFHRARRAFANNLPPVGRFRFAANWQPRQPIAILGLFSSEHGSQFFQVVAALGRNLVSNTPDFFRNFMFHNLTIPSVHGVYK